MTCTAIRHLKENLNFRTFTAELEKKAEAKGESKVKSVRKGEKDSDKTFYCYDFNKGKCPYLGAHEGKFNRMNVVKKHICKNCWQMDTVERKHTEGDFSCPNKNKQD